ncbi:hypothetical protein CHGG_10790 [Chaetomium globosum CBS 148.51]|uniref:FAD-binding PCMH-type domain-containing protein n=1 Tax=Chaetomium globosum (strain ATCC 6205 / CBS 148.51 / DSM 1962 / NBRC 6347 / NRRL 1970) TaxID=306901 RepID=Q2GML4_CHAGB|nr:uncharacterized protein CHGG_10790 [Chaetomium globosum CBS 148.51]EAQ82972.1 hypothetical protein CHGG_10790 [Chaetomium globosum CBS 148.51]
MRRTSRPNYPKEQWINDQDATLMWKYFTQLVVRADDGPRDGLHAGLLRHNNLRLIVRNTGHDFMGRSTGWGALVINTHSFQDVEFTKSWAGGSCGYKGSAVTVGAGVQGRALLRQAVAQDPPVTVVTGECPTVGIAGGFVQGGGHGPLTTIFGFAADNALSFDVITAEGEFVTANAKTNPELFWGLKGGGPGSYGVVVSASFKTFPEHQSAGATLYINSTLTNDTELFWEGVRIFHSHANYFVDNGLYVYFSVGPGSLRVRPFVAYNQTAAELEAVLAPLKSDLSAAGVPFYSAPTNQYATFFDLYLDLFEDETAGPPTLTSGWTFGRTDIEDNNDGIIEAFKTALSPRADLVNQGYMVGHLFGAGHASQPAGISATNPRFRDSSDLLLYLIPLPEDATLEQKADIQDLLTNTVDRAMKDAAPNGCAYVNEADPYQEDWQNHFWGPTVYPKLQSLKETWDPNGVFYALSTPGTEQWDVIEYGTRLCKRFGGVLHGAVLLPPGAGLGRRGAAQVAGQHDEALIGVAGKQGREKRTASRGCLGRPRSRVGPVFLPEIVVVAREAQPLAESRCDSVEEGAEGDNGRAEDAHVGFYHAVQGAADLVDEEVHGDGHAKLSIIHRGSIQANGALDVRIPQGVKRPAKGEVNADHEPKAKAKTKESRTGDDPASTSERAQKAQRAETKRKACLLTGTHETGHGDGACHGANNAIILEKAHSYYNPSCVHPQSDCDGRDDGRQDDGRSHSVSAGIVASHFKNQTSPATRAWREPTPLE